MVLNVSQKNTKSFNIVATYRPPQGNKRRYIQSIEGILKRLSAHEDMFVIGDLNINNLENTNSVKELKVMERDFGLKQLINVPTRITRKARTLIDHMYTNCNNLANSGVKKTSH